MASLIPMKEVTIKGAECPDELGAGFKSYFIRQEKHLQQWGSIGFQ
jgi:hypothetical protein